MATIIQWNCRGFRSNFEEVSLLHKLYCPAVFALQETFLKNTSTVAFKNFSVLHKSSYEERPSGGVALFIKKDIPFSPVSLNTPLEAVAAQISFDKTMTICSFCLSPSKPVSQKDS